MRTGIYTKIILTIIATMLIVIGFKLFVPSRNRADFREPDSNTLMSQAVKDMTVFAEKKNQDNSGQGDAGPTANAPTPAGGPQIQENAGQRQAPESQSEAAAEPKALLGRDLAEAILRGDVNDPHSQMARQRGGTIDPAKPTNSDALPELSRSLGEKVLVSFSPQFMALSDSDIDAARHGAHKEIRRLPDTIPADSHVCAVLLDPQGPPKSMQNFIRTGGNGVSYVLVQVAEDGRVGYMKISDYDKGTVPLGFEDSAHHRSFSGGRGRE